MCKVNPLFIGKYLIATNYIITKYTVKYIEPIILDVLFRHSGLGSGLLLTA